MYRDTTTAERVGFEPTSLSATRFPDGGTRPLCDLSERAKNATRSPDQRHQPVARLPPVVLVAGQPLRQVVLLVDEPPHDDDEHRYEEDQRDERAERERNEAQHQQRSRIHRVPHDPVRSRRDEPLILTHFDDPRGVGVLAEHEEHDRQSHEDRDVPQDDDGRRDGGPAEAAVECRYEQEREEEEALEPPVDPPGPPPLPAPGPPPVLPRFHYAWVVAAVTFVALLAAASVRAAPGIFITPLEGEFGWDRASISFAVAISLITFGLGGPIGGTLVDRVGPRRALLGGLGVIALRLYLLLSLRDLWQLYLLWGILIGICTGIASH